MDVFFIIVFGIIFLSFASGGGKKKKSSTRSSKPKKKTTSALYGSSSPAMAAMRQSREISQNDRAKASGSGGVPHTQQKLGQLYSLSKAKMDKALREAASDLGDDVLPSMNEDQDVRSFETTATSYVSERQPPLVRDMNHSRRRHLSSERRGSMMGLNILFIGMIALAVLMLMWLSAH